MLLKHVFRLLLLVFGSVEELLVFDLVRHHLMLSVGYLPPFKFEQVDHFEPTYFCNLCIGLFCKFLDLNVANTLFLLLNCV